jgi:hypothetical protein
VPERREEQKPPADDNSVVQPAPGEDTTNGSTETDVEDPYKVDNTNNSTYFEPPALHDPNDRAVQRSIAPVKTALYKQAASYRSVSTGRVTAQQAQRDAAGWSSVPK